METNIAGQALQSALKNSQEEDDYHDKGDKFNMIHDWWFAQDRIKISV